MSAVKITLYSRGGLPLYMHTHLHDVTMVHLPQPALVAGFTVEGGERPRSSWLPPEEGTADLESEHERQLAWWEFWNA